MNIPEADELTEQLKRVDSSLDFRKWTRRQVRWLMVVGVTALVAALVAVAANVGLQLARVEACERDNDLRREYVAQWQPVLSQPVPPLPPDATDAQIQMAEASRLVRERFQFSLDHGFALHGC